MPEHSARDLGLAIVAAASLVPAAAWACRCVPLTFLAAYKTADAVVLAEVEAASDRQPLARSYRLRVSESWKRRMGGTITVRSAKTSCLANLEVGRRYLVYLNNGSAGLSTEACSGNLPAEKAGSALASLRKGRA